MFERIEIEDDTPNNQDGSFQLEIFLFLLMQKTVSLLIINGIFIRHELRQVKEKWIAEQGWNSPKEIFYQSTENRTKDQWNSGENFSLLNGYRMIVLISWSESIKAKREWGKENERRRKKLRWIFLVFSSSNPDNRFSVRHAQASIRRKQSFLCSLTLCLCLCLFFSVIDALTQDIFAQVTPTDKWREKE